MRYTLHIIILAVLTMCSVTLHAQKQELTAEEKARIAEQRKVVRSWRSSSPRMSCA